MKGDGRFDVESISIRDKKLVPLLSSSGRGVACFKCRTMLRGLFGTRAENEGRPSILVQLRVEDHDLVAKAALFS
jgi:hypothetical protein